MAVPSALLLIFVETTQPIRALAACFGHSIKPIAYPEVVNKGPIGLVFLRRKDYGPTLEMKESLTRLRDVPRNY